MTGLRQVVPRRDERPPAQLIDDVRAAAVELRPFDDDICSTMQAIARALRRPTIGKRHPQLVALAFWLRAAAVQRLRAAWDAMGADGTVLVPRGAVFHIPPANVDTLFVYSWALAALAGNANVVRLPSETTPAAGLLLDVIGAALDEHPRVAAATAFVAYDHDDAVTAGLSTADVRVIWGGDETVQRIRAVPVPPRTVELTFPHRSSLAVLDAVAVVGAGEDELEQLAARFVNDAYWFDQLACASPQTVAWRGAVADVERARSRFYDALDAEVARQERAPDTGTVIAKLVRTADAAAGGELTSVDWGRPGVTVAEPAATTLLRTGPGGGLFYDVRIDGLDDLVGAVRPTDQTLTHFGFARDELVAFARAVNGRGIDRIVPVGDALAFDRFWDGYDLLRSFTKHVVVSP